jgi:lysophospholipase L1-like esterase
MTRLALRLAFWLLLPVSALQGLWLRRTAIRLPEATGARTGVSGSGEEFHLLALGDSIIAGVGTGSMDASLPVQFAHALAKTRQCSVHWHTQGANGADIADLRTTLSRFHQEQQADVILISIGVNDVTGLSSTRYWRLQVNQLVTELRHKWPRARVIFAGLPPMGQFPLPPQPLRFTLGQRAATLDAIAAGIISRKPGMLHIPTEINPLTQEFCADGFHPSAESCANWAAVLAQRFEADNLGGALEGVLNQPLADTGSR